MLVSVQARMNSTRLPGKVLLPLGRHRVIGWAVKRARQSERVESVIVTAGDHPPDDAIEIWCEKHDIGCIRGPEDDLLERHRKVARSVGSETIVRITGDCPFVPPSEIDRTINEHISNSARYTRNGTEETMPVGTAVDVIDTDLLDELAAAGERHPVLLPRSDPDAWLTEVLDSVSPFSDLSGVHMAVDTPDDYWRLHRGVGIVGDNPEAIASWIDAGEPQPEFGPTAPHSWE